MEKLQIKAKLIVKKKRLMLLAMEMETIYMEVYLNQFVCE